VEASPTALPPPAPSETPLPLPSDTAVAAAPLPPTQAPTDALTAGLNAAPASGKQAFCSGKSVKLNIPSLFDNENAPDAGWCGEVAIQMALLHFGKNVSQSAINKAGHPAQPDLWEDDIPVALDALGVNYTAWDRKNQDLNGFITWITEQLQAGNPVVLGVKIYPDEDPTWDNDHFVLAVGCDSKGFVINTDDEEEGVDGQAHYTYAEMTKNFEDSYSFINKSNVHYGWAISGVKK
jgi:hypothetical protein